jgi:hypothetical protein
MKPAHGRQTPRGIATGAWNTVLTRKEAEAAMQGADAL